MNSYAEYIKTVIGQEPENKLLEASVLYQRSFGTIPEMTYYKTLERMSRQGLYILPKAYITDQRNHDLEQFRSAKKKLSVTIRVMGKAL